LPQLALNGGDFGAQQVAHVGAGFTLAAPEYQKLVNLGQGKTQGLRLGDKLEVAHGAFVKQAKAAFASNRLPQQAPPLVKPDGMNADACFLRHFADAQCSRHCQFPSP
jgi:hypothetical protein